MKKSKQAKKGNYFLLSPVPQTNFGIGKNLESKTLRNFFLSMIMKSRLTILESLGVQETHLNSTTGSRDIEFNLCNLTVINSGGCVIVNKAFVHLDMIQFNPNFFRSIIRICKERVSLAKDIQMQKSANPAANSNTKNTSNININCNLAQSKSLKYIPTNDKCTSVIEEVRESSSELHPFTFQQNQSHFTNLNSNMITSNYHAMSMSRNKYNTSSRIDYCNYSDTKMDASLSLTQYENTNWSKKYLEINIQKYKVMIFSHIGLSFVGIFHRTTSTKLCRLILTFLFVAFANNRFSDCLRGGLALMQREDVILTKVYEVAWLNHLISIFTNSFNRILKLETKQLIAEDLVSYYLITISKQHNINAGLNSYSFDKNDYSILIDANGFLNYGEKVNYLKQESIFKEVAFHGEMLRDSFLKENSKNNQLNFETAANVRGIIK